MTKRWLAAMLVCGVCPAAAQAPPPQLVDFLAKPLLASLRVQADVIWQPRIDGLVQHAVAATKLGAAWNAQSPGWRQARAALGERVARVSEAHWRSSAVRDELAKRLSSELTPAETLQIGELFAGPAGSTILRHEIEIEFVSANFTGEVMQPSDPRFQARIQELRELFAARMPADVPAADPAHENEAIAFFQSPLRSKLSQILGFVGERALDTLSTRIQLMLFDDREAIGRELEAAVATVRPGS